MAVQTRKIVRIDEDKCDGCGLCVPDCAEGAIQVIDGKARLVAENLCDGLGNCLGSCPKDAITIEERPADSFDHEAAKNHLDQKSESVPDLPCGCPGTMMKKLTAPSCPAPNNGSSGAPSRLGQWPVQLTLLPVQGEIWKDADVLISADCVAFAMGNFHDRLLAGKTVAVGCPKLDDISAYTKKLTAIFAENDIRSVTIAHMEVPCCTGIVTATREALSRSGKVNLPVTDIIVGIDGSILNES